VEATLEAEGGGDCRHGYDARTEEGTGTAGGPQGDHGQHSGDFGRGRVDPCGGWFVGWCWRFVDEALRIFAERLIERDLPRGVDGVDLAVVHLVRVMRPIPAW
jgi:hypothetical protein